MKGSPSTVISRRSPPVAPMRAEKKLYLPASFDFGRLAGIGGDEHGGGGLGKEAEERMRHQRRILLDGCADAFGECGLRQGDGDAAVGDVARGTDAACAIGQHGQQLCRSGLGLEIERRRRAPEAAQNHLGVLRGAEGGQIRRGFCFGCIRLLARTGLGSRARAAGIGCMGGGLNGTSSSGSGSSPRGTGHSSKIASPALAGNPPERPCSHLPECPRCPEPAWDKCLRRASRCRAKHCRR